VGGPVEERSGLIIKKSPEERVRSARGLVACVLARLVACRAARGTPAGEKRRVV